MQVTKSFFQRIPFIRITSLFLIGILINHFIQIDYRLVGILVTILISILIFLWHNIHFSGVKTQNLLVSLCVLLSGIFYPNKVIEKQLPTFNQKDYFLAEICQKPIEKAKTYQSILWIQSRLSPKHEKVIAYFNKENFDTTLIPGDQLILLAQPKEIKNMGNPFEFDYQKMMQNKGIYYSVYLSPGTYRKTGVQINRLTYLAEQIRDKLLVLLTSTNIEKEERAVISALTLGYRTELEPETRDYFASTGTMHVLAVSGLHVGLIYLIISFLLSGINRGKIGSMIYPAAMIIFLWTYAFITGFSPSVQRATVMFTFVIVGNILRRPVNIYNSLSASALVLILHDPNVLFEVGFQLSYLAVFGIVLLQPPIFSMLKLKNKILKWLWALLSVSMAAQLITFPLGVLYFNQFPNLFWLSNFIVIPCATAIIWLTFSFFVLSPLPFISGILSAIIQFVTNMMLNTLKWMSALPYAVSEGIVFSPFQVWIIYGLIAAFVIYGFSRHKSWFFWGLTLIIFLQGSILLTKSGLYNQKAIYVYNSKNTLVHCINGRNNYVVVKGRYPVTEQEFNMIQNVCNHLKLKKPQFIEFTTMHDFDANDLKIDDKILRFLNCRIDLSNQLKFTIQGSDLSLFRIDNPGLSKIEITNTTLLRPNLFLNDQKVFSIDFTTKYKEVICIFLK